MENLIEEYMNARIKDLMVKPAFAKALKTPNGHIYLKVLRERVLSELNFTDGVNPDEFDYSKTEEGNMMDHSDGKLYHIQSLYNLNDLSNEKAIGFNSLEERAANISKNGDIAHENVFDKLLADFFLQKRSDIKKGNTLVKQLEETLGALGKRSEGEELQGEVGDHTLGFQYHAESVDKDDLPRLQHYKFTDLMHLDMTLNNHLHNKKSALSVDAKEIPDELVTIPTYYDFWDVRMPADIYVQNKFDEVLGEVFEGRRKLEKHLSR